MIRDQRDYPKTILELSVWYENKGLPPEEVTRFFIGKNYTKPRAYGIYKNYDTKEFIVYKNKDDGTRDIRYQGRNEEFAVKTLYTRLLQEIANQKRNNNIETLDESDNNMDSEQTSNSNNSNSKNSKKNPLVRILVSLIAIVVSIVVFFIPSKEGYYKYDDHYYYYQGATWYKYTGTIDWQIEDVVPQELKENYKEYYLGEDYSLLYDVTNFKYSKYYKGTYEEPDFDSSTTSWNSNSTKWNKDW